MARGRVWKSGSVWYASVVTPTSAWCHFYPSHEEAITRATHHVRSEGARYCRTHGVCNTVCGRGRTWTNPIQRRFDFLD